MDLCFSFQNQITLFELGSISEMSGSSQVFQVKKCIKLQLQYFFQGFKLMFNNMQICQW